MSEMKDPRIVTRKELTLDATQENLPRVMEFAEQQLEGLDLSMRTRMQIDVSVEEIYVNIASYAYKSGNGPVTIRIEHRKEPEEIWIIFEDRGVAYDPLAKEDPDITLSASERQIGGLGIFMAKKSMDDMVYEYRDNMNILTLKKAIR